MRSGCDARRERPSASLRLLNQMGGATVRHRAVCFAEQSLGVFVMDEWNPIASAVPGQNSAASASGIAEGLGRGDVTPRVVLSSDAQDNAYGKARARIVSLIRASA